MHLHVLKVQFYQQGDQERRMGLPISAFMDRENKTRLQFTFILLIRVVVKCQKGFFQFVAEPLVVPFLNFLAGEENMRILSIFNDNLHYWDALSD